jgi:Kef-type K+ transport system membrane component KefB
MIDHVTVTVPLVIAVIAQFASLRFGKSVAIIELLLGIVLGNGLGIRAADKEWLLFLSGAEVDNHALKRNLRPSLVFRRERRCSAANTWHRSSS